MISNSGGSFTGQFSLDFNLKFRGKAISILSTEDSYITEESVNSDIFFDTISARKKM